MTHKQSPPYMLADLISKVIRYNLSEFAIQDKVTFVCFNTNVELSVGRLAGEIITSDRLALTKPNLGKSTPPHGINHDNKTVVSETILVDMIKNKAYLTHTLKTSVKLPFRRHQDIAVVSGADTLIIPAMIIHVITLPIQLVRGWLWGLANKSS